MKNNELAPQQKYNLIQYALETGNISKACELFGVSRTSYYKWYSRYKEYGKVGLCNFIPRKPRMPNQIDNETEEVILEYIINKPKDGPKKISFELKEQGYEVGPTGIYKVLKRNNLNKKEERIVYAKKRKKKDLRKKEIMITDLIYAKCKCKCRYKFTS